MKAFWDNLFYDMEACGLSKEEFAEKAGKEVRDNLYSIECAIRAFDGQRALKLIDELRRDY